MLTIEQTVELGNTVDVLDSRFMSRLSQFMTVEQIEAAGFQFNSDEAKASHSPKEWTRDNILAQLEKDVEFGFEKALDQRGISASLMADVVKGWNKVLQEGLEDFDDYPMYGLPIFKATAVKYGFINPIGDDSGDEAKYNEY